MLWDVKMPPNKDMLLPGCVLPDVRRLGEGGGFIGLNPKAVPIRVVMAHMGGPVGRRISRPPPEGVGAKLDVEVCWAGTLTIPSRS